MGTIFGTVFGTVLNRAPGAEHGRVRVPDLLRRIRAGRGSRTQRMLPHILQVRRLIWYTKQTGTVPFSYSDSKVKLVTL